MTLILADTSVWVNHLRHGDPVMAQCLNEKRIRLHPYVVGELALGNLPNRTVFLDWIDAIHQVRPARDAEVRRLIEAGRHYGSGLGWVDLHLLASVLLTDGVALWTGDRRLHEAASRHGCAARLHH